MQSLGITDTGVIMDSYRRFLNYVMWSAKGASTTVHVEILRGLRGWTTVHFSRSP
jgi:hypothetical protein